MATPVVISIKNARSKAIKIFWVTHNGTLKPYLTIAPGKQKSQSTYAGHSWIAQEAGKTVSGYYASLDKPAWTIVPNLIRRTPSPRSHSPMAFRIKNRMNTYIEIFWSDFTGKTQFYATLYPGKQLTQRSFRGHRWLAVQEGKVLSEYTVGTGGLSWSVQSQILPVPSLAPGTNQQPHEGDTSHPMYQRPKGALRAIFVFVDFPDAPGKGSTLPLGNQFIKGVRTWFTTESFNKMSLTVIQQSGWKRMPKRSNQYNSSKFEPHKNYISDALALFPSINFTKFHIVYILVPSTANKNVSTHAFTPNVGDGAHSRHGLVRHVVTIGPNSYNHSLTTLIQETGHLLGLPDCYQYHKSFKEQFNAVGAWDLMSDVFRGQHFLGWHRHKLGWLHQKHVVCLKSGSMIRTLTPIASNNGTMMILIPIGPSSKISSLYAIQLSQPLGSDHKQIPGVLIYRIDARVASGHNPLVVEQARASTNAKKIESYGTKYNAPFLVGDTFSSRANKIHVIVTREVRGRYTVHVTKEI